MITAHGNIETAVQALKLGAFDFISKPLDLANLRSVIDNALRLRETAANEQQGLIGKSDSMLAVRDLIDKVSRSQAPVHISVRIRNRQRAGCTHDSRLRPARRRTIRPRELRSHPCGVDGE